MGTLGERLARGEQAAFAELYDACADRLHGYLLVRLGSREDAADVLQETFVRITRQRRRLRNVENVIAYTFATARNEASRLLGRRARQVRRQSFDSTDALAEPSGGELAHDAADFVTTMLNRLTAEYREVIELKLYAGLTFREIAETTGLPQGAVATRYRAAIDRLRGWLAEEIS